MGGARTSCQLAESPHYWHMQFWVLAIMRRHCCHTMQSIKCFGGVTLAWLPCSQGISNLSLPFLLHASLSSFVNCIFGGPTSSSVAVCSRLQSHRLHSWAAPVYCRPLHILNLLLYSVSTALLAAKLCRCSAWTLVKIS